MNHEHCHNPPSTKQPEHEEQRPVEKRVEELEEQLVEMRSQLKWTAGLLCFALLMLGVADQQRKNSIRFIQDTISEMLHVGADAAQR